MATVVGASDTRLFLVTAADAVIQGAGAACSGLRIIPPGAFEGLEALVEASEGPGGLAILSLDAPSSDSWSALMDLAPTPVAGSGQVAWLGGDDDTADERPRLGAPRFNSRSWLASVTVSVDATAAGAAVASGAQVRALLSKVAAVGSVPALSTIDGVGVWFAAARGPVAEGVIGVVRRAIETHRSPRAAGGPTYTGELGQPLRGADSTARRLEARRLAAMVEGDLVVEVRPVGVADGALWQVEIFSAKPAPAPADVDAARLLSDGLDGLRLRSETPQLAAEEAVALVKAWLLAQEALGLRRDSPRRDELLRAAALQLEAPLARRVDAVIEDGASSRGIALNTEAADLEIALATLAWHRSQGLPLVSGREAGIRGALDEVASHGSRALERLAGQGGEAQAWAADARHDLAVVEVARPSGEGDINRARASLEAAAQATPRSQDPYRWATVQRNLAEAMISDADRVEATQTALASALDVRTRLSSPSLYAEATLLAAEARYAHAGGDRSSLHKAISGFEDAVATLDPQVHRYLWARGMLSLAQARTELPFEDEGMQIERALTELNAVLEILSPRFFPRAWALAWTTMGYAYQVRTQGHRGDRFDLAIDAYRHALRVYDEQETPLEWAWTWTNLGTAYLSRPYGEPAQNVEEALAAYDLAETVFARSGRPELWATALNNRGNAYMVRPDGDRAANLAEAKRLFSEALELLSPAAFPEDHAQTTANLEIADAYLAAHLLSVQNPGTAREIEALGDAYLLEGLEYRAWILLTRREDRFEQAADAYRAAISRQPEAAIHHHKLSVALWKLGDLEAAIGAQDAAVELEPDNVYIGNWRRFLEAQRHLFMDPDSIVGWMTLAEFHLIAGELPEAMATYHKVTQLDARQTEAFVQLVRIHMSTHKPQAALRAAEAGLEASPSDFELLAMAHGVSQEYLFDYRRALGFARRMVKATDATAELNVTLMEALLCGGEGDELRSLGKQVLSDGALEADVEVIARVFLWLEALDRGRGERRAARRLIKAYEALPTAAPARWTWEGTRRWASGALPPDDVERAQGVIDLLSGEKPPGGDDALMGLVRP